MICVVYYVLLFYILYYSAVEKIKIIEYPFKFKIGAPSIIKLITIVVRYSKNSPVWRWFMFLRAINKYTISLVFLFSLLIIGPFVSPQNNICTCHYEFKTHIIFFKQFLLLLDNFKFKFSYLFHLFTIKLTY